MIFGLVFIVLYSASNFYQQKVNLDDISHKQIQAKAKERLALINSFSQQFLNGLNSIEENQTFRDFAEFGDNKEGAQHLFLSMQKSVMSTMQLRYVDLEGNELIRTETKGTLVDSQPIQHRIVPETELQNKSHRPYFQEFKKLASGEIGISAIELNMEHGAIVEPKQPTIRFAKKVFFNDKAAGIIIINVCMNHFISQFQNTTLYFINLIDGNGNFLIYKDPDKSILGEKGQQISIYDAYGFERGNSILESDIYADSQLFSIPVANLSKDQNVKMILESKYEESSKVAKEQSLLILGLVILTVLLMLPVAIHLSRSPDRLMEKLNNQAHQDELTSLPNKTSLEEEMEERDEQVLILLRIDNMRAINNVYGYELANKLICAMADKLEQLAQPLNFKVYKLPSNVFALRCFDCHEPEALGKLMQYLHNTVEEANFMVDENEFKLSITLGSSDPNAPTPLFNKIIDAEKAMRTAVDLKLDFSISNSSQETDQKHKDNVQMLELIRIALDNHWVTPFFQPIHNNQTEEIDKYEVLMRIQDDNGIIYPPSTFLEIAKASKYYHRMTREIVVQAVDFFKDKPYEFSINISFDDIMHDDFFPFLLEEVEKYHVCPRLVVEIVESEGLGDYTQVYDFIQKIKQMGCKVAIDDFGTGYSNFEHLLKLHHMIDYVKIDGSIIKDIHLNEINYGIVKNIKLFCDELKLETIAEFVAEEEIQNKVQGLGISYSQGFYFGQPHNELFK